jgi:hypothetical protein
MGQVAIAAAAAGSSGTGPGPGPASAPTEVALFFSRPIHLSELPFGAVIGSGAQGRVLRGACEGRPIAIKRIQALFESGVVTSACGNREGAYDHDYDGNGNGKGSKQQQKQQQQQEQLSFPAT